MRFTSSQRKLVTAASALTLAAATGTAGASGFQIREQSAAAGGNAMAGATAGAENLTYMAFNPAAIGRLEGTRIAANASVILAQFEVSDAVADNPFPGTLGGDSTGKGGKDAFVPALYAKWDLRDDLRLGLAVTAPFGLATEYDDDWAGRYHAVESDLMTVNINPVLAFKPTPELTLAAGLVAQYADATLSQAIDVGSAAAVAGIPGAAPGQNDAFAEVTGDDWGYGFNLGLLWQLSERTRVGLAYESEVSHDLEGEVDYSGTDLISRAAVATNPMLQDTDASASIDTPAVASVGIFHQLNDRWAIMGEVSWTRWSSFEELKIEFEHPAQDPSVTEFEWEDTFMVSVGANYRLNDRWTLRGGVGYDQSPVPDAEHRTPRLPDSDRRWLGAGFTWQGTDRLSVSASYVHVFFKDAEIDIPATATRSSLTGDAEASADVLSVSLAYRF